jgi:PTH1 family peptidyl-tRNA hydrolase
VAENAETWLVVGLGNPGPDYERTPHNLGFMVVDRLAEANGGIRVNRPDSQALVGVGRISGQPVVLAKPQTFMNLSGPSVKALLGKHEIPPERLVVIYDDLDLPWTGLRIRPHGSAGSHNGMKSVVGSIGTTEFPRVRLGIDWGRPDRDGAKFVLSEFRKVQMQELDEVLDYGSRAVESILADGVAKAMTKFNRREAEPRPSGSGN